MLHTLRPDGTVLYGYWRSSLSLLAWCFCFCFFTQLQLVNPASSQPNRKLILFAISFLFPFFPSFSNASSSHPICWGALTVFSRNEKTRPLISSHLISSRLVSCFLVPSPPIPLDLPLHCIVWSALHVHIYVYSVCKCTYVHASRLVYVELMLLSRSLSNQLQAKKPQRRNNINGMAFSSRLASFAPSISRPLEVT